MANVDVIYPAVRDHRGDGWQGYGRDDLRLACPVGVHRAVRRRRAVRLDECDWPPALPASLFANAAMAKPGGTALLFGEVVTLTMVAAVACVTVGVMLAIFNGQNRTISAVEMNRGLLSVGVGLVLAALAQAVVNLTAKPALAMVMSGGCRCCHQQRRS